MEIEEIRKKFEEDMPNVWSNFNPSFQVALIQAFSWGFEEGINQAEFNIKVGGDVYG